MKVGDNQLTAASPAAASQAMAPRKADAWQAQLERAWLESWRGDRPEHQRTSQPDATEAARPSATNRSDRTESAHLCEHGAGEHGSQWPERHSPSCIINARHEANRPAAAQHGLMVPPPEMPAHDKPSGAASASPQAEPLARFAQSRSRALGDTAAHAETKAKFSNFFDQAPASTPARSSLQVAVIDGAAQVTLRDATLNANEAARIPQAIAHQLLESGLASVRLYVNGRLSQHDRRETSLPRQRMDPDIGSPADPLHITPLERK